jgi:hypothetical protein
MQTVLNSNPNIRNLGRVGALFSRVTGFSSSGWKDTWTELVKHRLTFLKPLESPGAGRSTASTLARFLRHSVTSQALVMNVREHGKMW